jgi:hypothetical protein
MCLLTKEPALNYRHHSDLAKISISLNGIEENIELGPVASLASCCVSTSSPLDGVARDTVLKNFCQHLGMRYIFRKCGIKQRLSYENLRGLFYKYSRKPFT